MKISNLIELLNKLDIDIPDEPINCYLGADLAMDSQEIVELQTAIEKITNARLPKNLINRDMTILQLSNIVNERLTEGGF